MEKAKMLIIEKTLYFHVPRFIIICFQVKGTFVHLSMMIRCAVTCLFSVTWY